MSIGLVQKDNSFFQKTKKNPTAYFYISGEIHRINVLQLCVMAAAIAEMIAQITFSKSAHLFFLSFIIMFYYSPKTFPGTLKLAV